MRKDNEQPQYIDLHIHTTYSDGGLTPEEIIQWCVDAHIGVAAITDHNTIDGYLSVREKIEKLPIKIFCGVEFGAQYNGEELHILGVKLDPDSEALKRELKENQDMREQRVRDTIPKLQKLGFEITFEDVRKNGPGVLAKHHVVLTLMQNKKNREMIYRKLGKKIDVFDVINAYLVDDKPASMPKDLMSCEQAINTIHEAGGIAILAHPGQKLRDRKEAREVVEHFVGHGLDGIEVTTPKHNQRQSRFFARLADDFGLLKTAGSDLHYVMIPGLISDRPQTHMFVDMNFFGNTTDFLTK